MFSHLVISLVSYLVNVFVPLSFVSLFIFCFDLFFPFPVDFIKLKFCSVYEFFFFFFFFFFTENVLSPVYCR
jgi:hypothetical protein